ncbi:hypothetical protein [Candidatus Cardinium hertigii]|uniref:hypothetical protein n=3 Tax=Candidatus Cardinium TaxID=273135 RepID=UPI001FAA29AE|nr:hypothetical protein [Candidatus Cardinium hertigii]
MDNPKDIQEQIGSPAGLRQIAADYMSKNPESYNKLFKAQAGLSQLAPLQVPRMGWVHERFDPEYRDICKKISALEQKLTTNKAITPEEKAKDEQALVQLNIRKKALEEEGNKKDEELARSFIRLGTSTGVFLSSLPLVGPISATAAGIGAAHLSQGNEFEIIKQVLLFGAVGKVFEKLRKIPIINQAEGKMLAWVRNLSNQGGVGITKVVSEQVKPLPAARTKLGVHCIEQCTARGITKKMAQKAIEKRVRYYDPKHKSIVYVLHNGMASGDHLMLAVVPESGLLKTVFTRSKPIHKRLILLE